MEGLKPVVFDSSAVIAALTGEPGEEKVRASAAGSAFSSVNLAEVISYFALRGGSREAIHGLLQLLPMEIVPFDVELAGAAGMLAPATRELGLSLGDRACLALGIARGAKVLTADRAWSNLPKGIGADILLIR